MRIRVPFLKLPASDPAIAREHQQQFARVLVRGRFILGEELESFEREFAAFCGAGTCVGVASGTEAIMVALRLSGIRPGRSQEVVTTPLTASFTAHAIVAAGARPVFADVDPATLLLDPQAVPQRLTRRTAALLPVHLYGQTCDLSALRSLAREAGCALVQDAAQAHGANFRGRPLADFSDWVAFSFYPTKNLGALGDGGALVTNRPGLAAKARMFRDGGRRGSGHTAHQEGINSRLDEVQAAMLRVHLKRLKQWNRRREQIANLYDSAFAVLSPRSLRLPIRDTQNRHCHHLYVIRVSQRRAFRRFLADEGVETAVHYEKPLHVHPAFRGFGYRRGDFPIAERAAREVCSLPLHSWLSDADAQTVVRAVLRYFEKQ
jgi:dTDP-3-amino-3,4,6-trideoxy-alpha-D-glucose transaminase